MLPTSRLPGREGTLMFSSLSVLACIRPCAYIGVQKRLSVDRLIRIGKEGGRIDTALWAYQMVSAQCEAGQTFSHRGLSSAGRGIQSPSRGMAAKHLEAVEAVLSGPGLQESKGWGVADFMQELKKVPQRHPIDALSDLHQP